MKRLSILIISLSAFGAGCGDPPTPVLTCPEMVRQVECVPAAGGVLDLGVAATLDGDGSVTISCTPDIQTPLTPGMYDVACTAQSDEGMTATCAFAVEAIQAEMPSLTCPEPQTATCQGTLTAVDPSPPTVISFCGVMVDGPMSDAPTEGFPVGESRVNWSGTATDGSTVTCEAQLVVTDEEPPSLTCEAEVTVVRISPDDPIEGYAPMVSDNCAEDLVATPDMEPTERGSYTVRFTATDAGGMTSECTSDVLVLDVFPPTGPRILSARRNEDGTTRVTIGFEPSAGMDTDRYALQSATGPEGPWTDVRYGSADDLSITDPHMDANRLWYRIQAASGAERGGATQAVAAFAITNGAYDLRNAPVPGVPFRTTLYGVLHHPTDLSEARPLILMLHGNHGICRPPSSYSDTCSTGDFSNHECQRPGYTTTPNAEGMLYLTETLAAQGYIAVTISGNAMNCRSDFIHERTALLLEHMRRWKAWHEASSTPFGSTFMGAVDLTRVGLVGHSRGGEAVAGAPQALAATPITGVTLGSVFSIAPVDFHDPVPSGAHYAVLLPSCDGDVWTLSGRDIYDRSLPPSDPHARAQVLMARANHNYYNTEWRLNDNGHGRSCNTAGQVGAITQQGMLEATLGSWFAATLGGADFEPFMRSDAPTPEAMNRWARADLDLRWSFRSADHLLIDDLTGGSSPNVNDLGEPNTFTGFSTSSGCFGSSCSSSFGHSKGAVRLRWSAAGANADFGTGALMTAGYTALSFRMVSASDSRNSGISEQIFTFEATDMAGETVMIPNTELIRVPHSYYSLRPLELLQTVRLPLDRLAQINPAFSPSSIASMRVRFGDRARGAVYISDVELSGN